MAAHQRKIWIDGEFVPWGDATVHLLSQSLQRGTLIFDVMQIGELDTGTTIFGLREHTERFMNSARLNGMDLGSDLDALLGAIGEAVDANPASEIVKISAYYDGVSLDVLPADPRPRVAVAAFSVADVTGSKFERSATARLQVARPRKMPSTVLSPQVKIAASYTHAAMAKQRARAEGFHDVLFLDERGDLSESSTQSFFLVVDGVLRSAPTEIVLAGVTRRAVMDLARDEGFEIVEEPMPFELLARASEAFLTGTTTGVWPVEVIDDHKLPEPVPGPVAERLVSRYQRMLAGEDPVFSGRWMQPVPKKRS